MQKIYRGFDLFSQTPSLKINGGKRASTNLGSFVGLVSVTFLISGIIFILFEYIEGIEYNVNTFVDETAIPNIEIKKLKIGFHIVDYRFKEFEDGDKIFKLKARFYKFYQNTSSEIEVPILEEEEIDLIKCNQYKENKLFKDKFDTYSKKYKDLFCLDTENSKENITGLYSNIENK